jgi:hypothetical protein
VKCLVWLLASYAWAQQSAVSSRTYDINGRPVEGVRSVQSNGSKSQITRDANGRSVPVETVEERVVSESGSTKVIERTIRRYDPNGVPGPPERVRIEETKDPDGTIRSLSTVSRGDINGSFQLAERSTKVTRTTGNRVESTTAIERPTLNGSMDLVEKNEQTVVTSGPKTSENVTVFRRDPNGRMAEFAKKTREAVSSGSQVVENAAEYESASTGQMAIMRQTTATIDPGGTRQVTTYLPDAQGKLTLAQQQLIQKKETPAGYTETTIVRFASPNDPGNLGPPRKAEEIVCTGTCGRPAQP